MLQIEQLALRLPPMPEDEIYRLVQEVGQQLAQGLPDEQQDLHLGALQLRLEIPQGASRQQIVTRIVEAILSHLD